MSDRLLSAGQISVGRKETILKMITEATIISLEGEVALVECRRKSACDGCHKNSEGGCGVCSLTGADATITLRALNRAGGEVGDRVEIGSGTGRVLLYAALVFILPLAAALLGWLIGLWAGGEKALPAALAGAGFAVSFIGVWLYSRVRVSRRCDAVVAAVIERADKNRGFTENSDKR